jgi:hypothetical protein
MELRLRSGAISVQRQRFDADGNVSASHTLPSISKRSCLKLTGRSYVELLESAEVSLVRGAAMLTGNIRSFVDSSTARSNNYGRVLLNAIGRSLIALSFYLRNVGHPWWELSDNLLADIGKTPGDAEVEKLRHRPVIHDPRP